MQSFRILMVEDNPDHAFLAETCLTQGNPDVVVDCVSDGERALEALDRARSAGDALPDLVLVDLNMPGMNGIDFLRCAKRHDRYRLIPTVMLSSSSNPSDVAQALDNHANSFVTKSVDFIAWETALGAICSYWRDHDRARRVDEKS